jgi:branched-chain amino acid transport system substrate-binding protein
MRPFPTLAVLLIAAPLLAPLAAGGQTKPAAAKQAAAPQEIVIGHVAGYTGPVRDNALELAQGAQVLFDAVNESGGFNGRKFRILVADDQFKPENTVQLVAEMKGKAVALLPINGSANAAALIKDGTLGLPLVGTIPSPDVVRNWKNPNLFHIRASDREQAERILEQLVTIGLTNIALLVPNNPFGEQSTKIAEAYLARRNLKLAANAVYLLAGPKADLEPGLKALQGKSYQALVILGPPNYVAEAIKRLRTSGETAQLYTLSYADAKVIVKEAGLKLAHGVVISQVMPNLNSRALPLVRELHEHLARYGKTKAEATYFNIEGYIAAKLIVEAIRRSRDPSPEGVRRGLEQIQGYDLGGFVIDFSPAKHHGSSFVDLSLIGGSGRLVY